MFERTTVGQPVKQYAVRERGQNIQGHDLRQSKNGPSIVARIQIRELITN